MKKIRTLKPQEIEVRVGDRTKNGKIHMLLYITSRAAQDLLDETYGMENWNMEYKDVAGQIYGRLSIYDGETDRWVVREDTGEEAKISADKSLASDILKRCIVRFGCTELYSSPAIYLDDDGYGNYGYKVSDIQYDENRKIIALTIVNKFGQVAYTYPQQMNNYTQEVNNNSENNTVPNSALLREFCTVRKNCGEDLTNLTKFFNYYKDKVDGFAKCNPQSLWNKWNSKN